MGGQLPVPRWVLTMLVFAVALLVSPLSADTRVAWEVPFPGLTSVPQDQLGVSIDVALGVGSGSESDALGCNISLPYIFYNTLMLEPFFGLSALFPPDTPIITPGYEGQTDDDRIGRFSYGVAVYIRPFAFRLTRTSSWSYPFIGVRGMWLSGIGQTQQALDCLYCSDTEASYRGGENAYLAMGYMWQHIIVRFDVRVTNKEGYYGESAYDPFHVGPSYDYQQGPYWEPRVMITVAWYGLRLIG